MPNTDSLFCSADRPCCPLVPSSFLPSHVLSTDQFRSRGTMASCTTSPCQQHAAGSGLWRRQCQMQPPPALEEEERRRPALPPALLAASFSTSQYCGRISELQLSVQHPTTEVISHTTPASPIHYKTLPICVIPHIVLRSSLASTTCGRAESFHCILLLLWLGWNSRSASSVCSCSFYSSTSFPCGSRKCWGPWSSPGSEPAGACFGTFYRLGWKTVEKKHGGKLKPSGLQYQCLWQVLFPSWTSRSEVHTQHKMGVTAFMSAPRAYCARDRLTAGLVRVFLYIKSRIQTRYKLTGCSSHHNWSGRQWHRST